MSENIVHVSQTSFDEDVLNADRPVLVDYWAEWCGPCKMIAPILDEIAQEYGDRGKVCKVNVDENQAAAERYGRGLSKKTTRSDSQQGWEQPSVEASGAHFTVGR